MSEFHTYIEVEDGVEIDVIVEYDYSPASNGHKNRYGVPTEPNYPEDLEITKITDMDGTELILDEADEETIKERILESIRYDNDPDNQDYDEDAWRDL